MIEVIGVKFKSGGKMYYFAPGNLNPAEGSYVVVETARGPECGEVAARRHAVQDSAVTAPLKPILRLANEEDLRTLEKNRAYIAEAERYCRERIEKRGLPMNLIDVECGFDSNKLIFYFTAESRVDFRELVKDLALAFHVRIELRQIGDRDEAKLLGGLGICGREFCCKGYLNNFQPISIKIAKEQGLALNPAKISGACGRLMCCLRYESPVYEELIKLTPKVGSTVLLPGDPPIRAYVLEANLITGNLRVKPENSDIPVTVSRDAVERLTDASRRMTKEDLRRDRDPAKQPQKPQPQQGKKQKQQNPNAAAPADGQEKPQPEKKPQQPREKRNPERQVQPAQTRQPQEPQQARPAQQPQAQPHHAQLHEEFGEKQQRQQPAPPKPAPRHAAAPIDMDLTEHRAVVEHPEQAAQQRSQQEAQRSRNPQGNRRRFPPRNRNHGNGGNHAPEGGKNPTDAG